MTLEFYIQTQVILDHHIEESMGRPNLEARAALLSMVEELNEMPEVPETEPSDWEGF